MGGLTKTCVTSELYSGSTLTLKVLKVTKIQLWQEFQECESPLAG